MNNTEIVAQIAKDRLLENIINRITKNGTMAHDVTSLGDLAQDIYLSLLQDKNLEKVYEEGHISFYVTRILMNNICSSSSRYYCQYLKPLFLNAGWNDNYNDRPED